MWTGRECIQWRVGLEQGTEWPDGSLATPAQERRRKNLASSKGYTAIQLRMQMRVNPSKIQLPHLLSCEIKYGRTNRMHLQSSTRYDIHVCTNRGTHATSCGKPMCAVRTMQSANRAADELRYTATRHSGSSVQ